MTAEKAITEKAASYDDGETAICFMGHGTEADSWKSILTQEGYEVTCVLEGLGQILWKR